jgi:hypothetical protein
MTLTNLGRRYERLLFFAAPLALASILTLFVVLASNTQDERNIARCYHAAASLIDTKKDQADDAWDNYIKSKRSSIAKNQYDHALRMLIIDTKLGPSCWKIVLGEVERRSSNGVETFVSGLRADSKRLFALPVRYMGVELPEKATIGLLGTNVAVDLQLFISMLQVVLAPLLLLWLGSLYNTRYRETLLIGRAKLVTDVFPHLINVYPAVRYPEPRRHSYLKPKLALLFAALYTVTRISLLSVFVGPVVTTYIASVLFADAGPYSSLLYGLAAVVAVFSLVLLLCEMFPWHVIKTFPGPPLVQTKE